MEKERDLWRNSIRIYILSMPIFSTEDNQALKSFSNLQRYWRECKRINYL